VRQRAAVRLRGLGVHDPLGAPALVGSTRGFHHPRRDRARATLAPCTCPGAGRVSLRSRLATTPEGYRYSLGRVLAVYAALMVTLFFAALDQTIVVTALPRIVADVGGLTSYSWIVTAYMLALTVTVPLYGKLVDVYGARRPFIGAIALFLVGSGLCALAQTMPKLVAFRAVQGLGAGGLVPLALSPAGGLAPPRDGGRYQGLMGAPFAAAAIGAADRRPDRRQRELALDLPGQPAARSARARCDLARYAARGCEAGS